MNPGSGDQRAPQAVHYAVWLSIPGGMESYVTAYIAHFHRTRHTHLFSLRPAPNRLSEKVAGFTTGSDSNLKLYFRWFRYCRTHRGDLFHLLNSGPVILLLALLAGVRRPIYHIHGTRHWKGRLDKWLFRLAWRLTNLFAMRIIANSQHSADTFTRHVLPVKPMLVYNGFHSAPLLAGKRLRSELRNMAYVGRMAPGKNAYLALRLFNAIAAHNEQVELHLAGTGKLKEELMAMAQAGPYPQRIHFHGWVEDMPDFYTRMDLMLFPSEHESFGNVLAEGLVNGLPVLTSDVPVFEEIHGNKALFCLGTPADVVAFERNFLNAIGQFDIIARHAFAASDRVAATFAMEHHLTALERIYEST